MHSKTIKTDFFAVWQPSGSVLLQCFCAPLGDLLVMRAVEYEWYILIRIAGATLPIESTDSKIIRTETIMPCIGCRQIRKCLGGV